MITASGITGCCQGRNFHRVGGAHGVPNYRNQDAFDRALYSKYPLYINIVVTNFEQSQAREYLAVGGWETKIVGNLWISTISHTDFNRYKTSLQSKWREEELKKREAEIARRETLPTSNRKKITLEEIRRVINYFGASWVRLPVNRGARQSIFNLVNRHYGINIRANPTNEHWSYYSLHNSVVRRVHNKNK